MWGRVKKYFFSGLAVFLPLGLTIYVFIWLMNFVEGFFGKPLKAFFLENYDFYFWGLGIVVLVLVIVFCGFLVSNYFGRTLHVFVENLLLKIPFVGGLYPAFKEVARFLFRERKTFEQAVLVEWPSAGEYILGFLTNTTTTRISDKVGARLCNVFIPNAPNPLSGFVVFIPENKVMLLDITIEEAMKTIVSGGVLNIEDANEKILSAS